MDSDTRVLEDLVAELRTSPFLHFAHLGIDVLDGVVTISGQLNSSAERKAVEHAAHRVAGIRSVILEIRARAIPLINNDDAEASFKTSHLR